MQKRFGIGIVSIIILILVLSSVSVLAEYGGYGQGRYNVGAYGYGESDSGAASSGGGSSGGGGGNSGSSSTSRSEDTGTISLETPNDLPGDAAQSTLEITCDSGPCSVTSAEVNNLPADVASVYESEGGLFVAAIRLACTGEIGVSTVDFTIDASQDLNCDGIKVTMVEDDGSRSNLEQVECTENDDGSLHVQATFNSCSYIILWETGDQLQPTLEQLGTSDQGVEEETALDGQEVQEAEGSGGLTILIVALVLLILVVLIISLVKKKKSKF